MIDMDLVKKMLMLKGKKLIRIKSLVAKYDRAAKVFDTLHDLEDPMDAIIRGEAATETLDDVRTKISDILFVGR